MNLRNIYKLPRDGRVDGSANTIQYTYLSGNLAFRYSCAMPTFGHWSCPNKVGLRGRYVREGDRSNALGHQVSQLAGLSMCNTLCLQWLKMGTAEPIDKGNSNCFSDLEVCNSI